MIEGIRKALERGFEKECIAYVKYQLYSQIAQAEMAKASSETERQILLSTSSEFARIAQEEYGHAHHYLETLDELKDSLHHLQSALEMERNDIVEYSISATAARSAGEEKAALIFERIQANEENHVVGINDLLNRLQSLWLDERLN